MFSQARARTRMSWTSSQPTMFAVGTSTVLAPFTQGEGFELTAMLLGGTKTAPELSLRLTDWTPPKDLRPEIVATRAPIPAVCP